MVSPDSHRIWNSYAFCVQRKIYIYVAKNFRELETIKIEQIEILELKHTIARIKNNSVDGFKSRLVTTETGVSNEKSEEKHRVRKIEKGGQETYRIQ